MTKKKNKNLNNRKKQIGALYKDSQKTNEDSKSSKLFKSINIQSTSNDEINVDNYVIKDLLKTFYFILFTILLVLIASILFTDYAYAGKIRDSINIDKVSF